MHTKTLACLLLSLVTYTQAVAVAPLIDPSSAALNGPGSSIATRSTQDDALNWCRTEKGGVPLWYPNKDSDFKDLGQPGLVRVNDVREALLVGEPAGKKGTSPVLQARLAAMAAWAQFVPNTIRDSFIGWDGKPIGWCLPGDNNQLIINIINSQWKKDGKDWVQDKDGLKTLVQSAGEQSKTVIVKNGTTSLSGTDHLTATWPFFLNQAYQPDHIQPSSASDCQQKPDGQRADCDSQTDPWNSGEQAAVHFLSDVTGEPCEITGDYKADNGDMNKILDKANETPVIAILPDPSNNDYLKGFWSVEQVFEDPNDPQKQRTMGVWDYVEGQHRVIKLPAKMKVVHIKGAGGEPDGKWDKWANK